MYEGVLADLIDELGQLPGIGPKSAQRIAFYLLQAEEEDVKRLANTLLEVQERVKFCERAATCLRKTFAASAETRDEIRACFAWWKSRAM